jgi:hypothetical protein
MPQTLDSVQSNICKYSLSRNLMLKSKKGKVISLHAMEALGERGGIAPTHS